MCLHPFDHCNLKNTAYQLVGRIVMAAVCGLFWVILLSVSWLRLPEHSADLIDELNCVLYGCFPKYAYSWRFSKSRRTTFLPNNASILKVIRVSQFEYFFPSSFTCEVLEYFSQSYIVTCLLWIGWPVFPKWSHKGSSITWPLKIGSSDVSEGRWDRQAFPQRRWLPISQKSEIHIYKVAKNWNNARTCLLDRISELCATR
jgi:hypothetical protein